MGKTISNEMLELIKEMLEKNYLLTLSTSSKNMPHSNTAFYAFDKDCNIYIWSEESTTHSKNLSKNKKVAITIFDSGQKWGDLLAGLQATGTAAPLHGKEAIKAGILYIKRFPTSLKLVKNPSGFHDKLFESKLYRIKMNKIKIFNEKKFGKGGVRAI